MTNCSCCTRTTCNKLINPKNIILIGTRNFGQNELQIIKQHNIKHFTAKHIFEYEIKDIADTITETASQHSKTYLSIDIDIINPSEAPGTGCPEPAGLTSRETLYLIQRIRKLKNLARVDIVEVNPDKDINNQTVRLAARILKELI